MKKIALMMAVFALSLAACKKKDTASEKPAESAVQEQPAQTSETTTTETAPGTTETTETAPEAAPAH